MMPPGLTASLREDEFIDLVRFLSELGKEGDFKTGPQSYIRKWKVLKSHSLGLDQIRHMGDPVFAKPSKEHDFQWIEVLSRVNGELKPGDLPNFEGVGTRFNIAVARFGLNPEQKGKVTLKINDTSQTRLFDGEKEIKLPNSGSTDVEVSAGGADDRFTIVLRKGGRKQAILIEAISK